MKTKDLLFINNLYLLTTSFLVVFLANSFVVKFLEPTTSPKLKFISGLSLFLVVLSFFIHLLNRPGILRRIALEDKDKSNKKILS